MEDTVVIAGAGPSGLMLAAELGLAGVRAIVVERDTEAAGERFSPGTTVHARSVELLDRRGLMDDIQAVSLGVWPRVHFSNIWVDLTPMIEEEYSIIVLQALTERVLAAHADKSGAEIRRGHEVTGLQQDEDGVTVRVRSGAEDYELRCRYLVACDGGDSTVRSLAGIQAPPTGSRWYGHMADFDAANEERKFESPDYENGLYAVSPHPQGLDQLRVMTMEFGVEPPSAAPTIEDMRAQVRRITGKEFTLTGEPVRIYRYSDRGRLAERYRSGNVFLAGDAAHLHYWGAGHGLNTSLHDVVNLGWKLAASIHGWAPPGLLDTYEAERYPVGRRACAVSQAGLALASPPEIVRPLREVFAELMAFKNVERHVITMVTDVAYPMPLPGAADEAHPLVGRPVPSAALTTASGQTATQIAMRSGHGVLFDFSDGAQDVAGIEGWKGRVDRVDARPTERIDATALLVRPDGYVAWAVRTGKDAEGLTAALTTWFGSPAER